MVIVEPPCSWPLPRQIDPHRFEHADEVHAAVFEETAVLDCEHRVHHYLGDVGVLDHLPLGALFGIEQGGDQLGFQFIGGKISCHGW